MTVCLLVITDGRAGYHERTMASAADMLPDVSHRVMVNDCADPAWCEHLDDTWGDDFDILHPTRRRGFAGAIQAGWDRLRATTSAEWVFHLEADFTFNEPVDIASMAAVLERHPHLVQMALRRQPWNDAERAAGGIVEQHPGDYTDHLWDEHRWLEHRRFFTTNPSLYRASLCDDGWPQVPHSEGIFTHQLLTDPAVTFGFWGARSDPPKVHHIGDERAGHGY